MLTCANCQFANPADHKFCQRCGSPLSAAALQARLVPPEGIKLVPGTFLDRDEDASSGDIAVAHQGRYQVMTVLSPGRAKIVDEQPQTCSSLQQQLTKLTELARKSPSQPRLTTISDLKAIPGLPQAAYPYLLLPEAAPLLYDTWEQENTTILIVAERSTTSSILESFSTAVDPLQHVYWMYQLTDLWGALDPIPQWRSSLLLTDNLGIDADQSLRILKFIPPVAAGEPLPQLGDLKVFLQSLLALPHRGAIALLHQVRQLTLAVSEATTLTQLSTDLASIGEAFLATPAAVTPAASAITSASQPTTARDATALLPLPTTLPPKLSTSSDMSDNTPASPSPNAQVPGDSPLDTDESRIDHSPVNESTVDESPVDEPLTDDSLLEEVLPDPVDLPEVSEGSDATMVLPMKLVSINDAGQTDVGRQRDHNEDCFLIARDSQHRADNGGQRTLVHGLYILCDGMGGHDGGEVASQLAAKTLSEYFETCWPASPLSKGGALPDEATVVEGVKLANRAIFDVNEAEQRAGHERMGTTLVMVLLQGTSAVVAHVGDSRLYQHSRRVGLRQVTNDHEVGQREIARGVDPEMAYARPDAYQLTQALGPRGSEDLVPSVSYLSFTEDTLLLLCSDGLSDNDLVEDYLDTHVDPLLRSQKALAVGVNDLISLSNEVNGHDNITAIAVRLEVSPDLEKSRLS